MDERMDRSDAKQDDIMQVMVTSFGSIDSKVDKLIEAEQGKGDSCNCIALHHMAQLNFDGDAGRKRAEDKRKEADELTKLKQKFEKEEIYTARVGKYNDVKRNRLKDTGTWLLCEEAFKAWSERAFRILWVLGEAGTGKSHLSGLIVETLLKDATQTPRTSVGYFFFSKATLSVRKALCSVVSQIAEMDRTFCAKATREIGDKSPDELTIEELWSKFFSTHYQKGSTAQLYIVLDGIDEADPLEADQLLQLLGSEEIEMRQIQVLLVGRAKLGPDIEKHFKVRHEIINVTSEKNHSDVKKLIEDKIAERSRLRSLPAEQQDEIIKIMLDKAQG
jgi:type II secretory pathway predicted ATPase ExeA